MDIRFLQNNPFKVTLLHSQRVVAARFCQRYYLADTAINVVNIDTLGECHLDNNELQRLHPTLTSESQKEARHASYTGH